MKIPIEIINIARATSNAYKLNFVGILVHWGIESRWGTSGLTNVTNNHFNMKCPKDCTAAYKVVGTKKAFDKTEKSNDAYRVYKSIADGFDAYGYYLRFERKKTEVFYNDPSGYFSWLKGMGYMTDKRFITTANNTVKSVVKYLQDNGINPKDEFTGNTITQPPKVSTTNPKDWGIAHQGIIPTDGTADEILKFVSDNALPIAIGVGALVIVLILTKD
ncbi:MAG: glucosaminidase domain-containing protein [Ignavibacteria bacterium]|nr:glucosaminidase domain-containing protein [Ignavibacteria bacterium]